MITQEQKQGIKSKLSNYCDRMGSQNKAAKSIGVSTATVTQVLNDNWELISDNMWRLIGAKINYSSSSWVAVQTRDFLTINSLLRDAQLNSNVFAVTGNAGSGKSFALKEYAALNERVYLILCNEYFNRKHFLAELLTAMGSDSAGYTVSDMMADIVRILKRQDRPLIIIDEADKLPDQVLYFFITLYNQLEDHCGIVLCATSHLEKRISNGVKLNRKGYREIYSRIGRRFIRLHGVGFTDVIAVCKANDVEDQKAIKEIFDDSEEDLRRVKRKIHAYKMKLKQTQQN